MHHQAHHHDTTLVVLSFLIAIFASYTALDLANSISVTRGRVRGLWLIGGSLAMGIGIWSMHFIGMLAFSLPGLDIYYDIPLCLLSILVAVLASCLALFLIATKENPGVGSYTIGSLAMGFAIAGMHYIGIWSMRMNAVIKWDPLIVIASIAVAIAASFGALLFAFKFRGDLSVRSFLYRGFGGTLMGFAIAGMHYTGMAAMHLIPTEHRFMINDTLLATNGLATAVIIGTILILSIALTGSNIDRALTKKTLVNETLQQAIRARDEFLSVASHELKTPLTSIKLQNQMILRNSKKESPDLTRLVEMLQKSDENIDRINRLIDDMLDISRLSTGRLTLQKDTADLGRLTTEVIERLLPVTEEAGNTVGLKLNGDLTGSFDRFRIEQVITNLITNAAKYAAATPIDITVTGSRTELELVIKDQGAGIARDDQERIFQRFERASTNIRGMGLGLFIVKEIVTMHAGSITLVSKPDEGTSFTVRLPKV